MGANQSLSKRILDVAGATAGLLLTSPALAAAAIAIRVCMGRPVLFRQKRGGRHGKLFTIYKLRTMTELTDENGHLLPDSQRMTPVGRFIRQTSIDEIPQFWSVLEGDMSLVGPRPLKAEYLPLYNSFQSRRHVVKPGITGWAQIQGRNGIDWDQKFALDVWYVDHRTIWLDIRILAITFWNVITRSGIDRGAYDTIPDFVGTRSNG